jgi:hypothetical protein
MPTASHSRNVFDFTSSVGVDCLADLQALLFFHPRQQAHEKDIQACITEFGAPQIQQRNDRLYVGIENNGAQGLLACHPAYRPGAPAGVVIYLRTSRELLRILHLAVHPAYEHGGRHAPLGLALLTVNEVLSIARRVAGVRRIQLPYVQNSFLSVPPLSATPPRQGTAKDESPAVRHAPADTA